MKIFFEKVKKFFTVKNSLIVIIGFLLLIVVFQNIHRFGGPGNNRGPGQQMGASGSRANSLGGVGIPGMGGGGRGSYGASRLQ